MDIEKLAESVRLCGSTPKVDQCKQCAYWSGGDMSKCIPRMTTDAADALSTLQAENEKLRAELEQVVQKYETAVKLQVKMTEISNRQMAELEQVKAERDAAIRDVEALMWYSGDGCRICTHGVEVYREPYVRLKCNIEKCQPKWHGHKKED